jgi:hypothetical protein
MLIIPQTVKTLLNKKIQQKALALLQIAIKIIRSIIAKTARIKILIIDQMTVLL